MELRSLFKRIMFITEFLNKPYVINTLVFVSLTTALYIGESIGPTKVGFWCNDESIRHKYLDQVVDYRLLLYIVLVLPSKIFYYVYHGDSVYWNHFRNYYYGAVSNILLTLFCKSIIGRPRPNFYSLCKPAFNKTLACRPDEKLFISNYTCTNTEPWLVSNSNQSFFSGHSCQAAYFALYMILYLQDHLIINGFLKAHLMFLIFMLSLVPGLTQYLNFWHFASDVVVGYVIGILLALFAYYGIEYIEHTTQLKSPKKKLKKIA